MRRELKKQLKEEAARVSASTPAQRRALYRFGKSKSFVKRFGKDKKIVEKIIQSEIKQRGEIEKMLTGTNEEMPWTLHDSAISIMYKIIEDNGEQLTTAVLTELLFYFEVLASQTFPNNPYKGKSLAKDIMLKFVDACEKHVTPKLAGKVVDVLVGMLRDKWVA